MTNQAPAYYVTARSPARLLRVLMCGPFTTLNDAWRMIDPVRRAAIRMNHEMIGADYSAEIFTPRDDQDAPDGVIDLTDLDPMDIINASATT